MINFRVFLFGFLEFTTAILQKVGTELRYVILNLSIIFPKFIIIEKLNLGKIKRLHPEKKGNRQLQIKPWPKWVGNVHKVFFKSLILKILFKEYHLLYKVIYV